MPGLHRATAAESKPAPSKRIDDCPTCGGRDLTHIYTVRNIPIHSCILMPTREAASNYATRDLELAACGACGFVFNRIFDPDVQEYSANFEESQHFSGTFNQFAKKLARQIADKCDLRGKHVLEIGCGKGEFLLELCSLTECTGLGIDPGWHEDRIAGKGLDKVEFIADFFGPDYFGLEADIILCRHTLEHIGPTSAFVRDIRRMIGERRDVKVVFETPDAERVLREGAFWDIYYEHCSYFSAGTHARLFRQESFDVTDLDLVYDRQYIIQFARPADGPTAPRLDLERDLDHMLTLAERLPETIGRVQDHWRSLVETAGRTGRRVILWGGGSKAVAFLTTLGVGGHVDLVVDINPYKQGRFVPGTGHAVVAPGALEGRAPDLVVVMNPVYLKEIGDQLAGMGMYPELVAV